MNRKMYRICLVVIIIVATISGIYYYRLIQKRELNPKDGIFVHQSFRGSEVV